jgi:hypothetical protein
VSTAEDFDYSSSPPRLCFRADTGNSKNADISELLVRLAPLESANDEELFELEETTPISNQGGLGSCVANSTCDAWELIMEIPIVQVSRLAIYWLARNYHNATHVDDGTFVRYAFDAIRLYGLCPEYEWPYEESRVFYQPPVEVLTIGSANKIESYYEIKTTGEERLNQIDRALYAKHPVVFGTGVSSDFTSFFNIPNASEVVWARPKSIKGYHAMVIVGRRVRNGRRQYKIRNSWGTRFGVAGYAWFDQDYITWGETTDLWVPSLMPRLIT